MGVFKCSKTSSKMEELIKNSFCTLFFDAVRFVCLLVWLNFLLLLLGSLEADFSFGFERGEVSGLLLSWLRGVATLTAFVLCLVVLAFSRWLLAFNRAQSSEN